MDASYLATLMLRWEMQRRELDELEAAIRDSVLQLGKTQTVGNVRATYSAGRKSYDYRAAIDAFDPHPSALEPFQSIVTDYRAACQGLDIADVPFTEGTPSVSLKLL